MNTIMLLAVLAGRCMDRCQGQPQILRLSIDQVPSTTKSSTEDLGENVAALHTPTEIIRRFQAH
jgi:hypothetical protein